MLKGFAQVETHNSRSYISERRQGSQDFGERANDTEAETEAETETQTEIEVDIDAQGSDKLVSNTAYKVRCSKYLQMLPSFINELPALRIRC
jgi:hypothetical protein